MSYNIFKKGGSEIIVIVGGIKDQNTLFEEIHPDPKCHVEYIFAYIWLIFMVKCR